MKKYVKIWLTLEIKSKTSSFLTPLNGNLLILDFLINRVDYDN